MLAIATQWVGLIGVLGGVIATGAIGFITAVLSHGWQRTDAHEQRDIQLREAKATVLRETCTRMVTAVNVLAVAVFTSPGSGDIPESEQDAVKKAWSSLRLVREENRTHFDEMEAAQAELEIVAGDSVRTAARSLAAAFSGLAGGALVLPEPSKADPSEFERARDALLDATRAEHSELMA